MALLPHVILPGAESDLLRRELSLAFAAEGCRVSVVAPETLHDPASPQRLSELLGNGPSLLFSVNFQGLGPLRQTLELLERAGGRAAVWCVDNPWNLLSGVRDPRWKTLDLFVTDASFIAPLGGHGAVRVWHLPLAACPEVFAPDERREAAFPPPENLAPIVFVGRSAFPGKAAFFAGQEIPAALLEQALSLLPEGGRPDLLWWERELGSPAGGFWPGKKARLPALGAEDSNLAWRALCLAEAAAVGRGLGDDADGRPGGDAARDADRRSGGDVSEKSGSLADGEPDRGATGTSGGDTAGRPGGGAGLDIIGDGGWAALLPVGARLRPPVDYYARLPGVYRRARYSLCLTSLQLPQGLNQRHFDVWTAGGFCLCDATPGLSLFPAELTGPVTFARPGDIGRVITALERGDRSALALAWRAHLREHHTYAHRVRQVLERLDGAPVM